MFIAYIVSFIDRTILSLLVEPIKIDLVLSDLQIGLVSGLAFGVFYSLMGLPLGWLVDSRSRRAIIITGIAVWSLATAACGLARNFEQLFAARVLVGVGEAALAPAALSLIADLFPPEKRARAVATFVMAGSVGGGAAMILGGGLIKWITTFPNLAIPIYGELKPWQLIFITVGLPGLLLCIAFAVFPEPTRRNVEKKTDAGFLAFLRSGSTVILPLFTAMTLLSVVAYGFLAWIPSFFIRDFGWTAEQVGLRFGLVFLICGAAGALSGGVLASRLRASATIEANQKVVTLGLAALSVPAALAPLQSNGWISLFLFAPTMFFFAFPSGAAAAAVQDLAPNAYRGRAVALYYIVMSLFGLSVGAVAIATLASWLSPKGDALGAAMAIVAAVVVPAAALCAWKAQRAHKTMHAA